MAKLAEIISSNERNNCNLHSMRFKSIADFLFNLQKTILKQPIGASEKHQKWQQLIC